MKNLLKKSLIVLLIAGCSFVSCKDDDDETTGGNCVSLASEASDAAMAYASNPSSEKCKAYKAAIEAYFNGCNQIDATTKDTYQQAIDALTCE